jgi:hypothetical protein
MTEEKPPVGLRPEWIFEESRQYERLQEISDAIGRYSANNKPVPDAWARELSKRIDEYRNLATTGRRLIAGIGD